MIGDLKKSKERVFSSDLKKDNPEETVQKLTEKYWRGLWSEFVCI